MADEGFHEIQLSGKHLVALFMAATVVAVVIFLCGVMVGRDVQKQRVALAAAAAEAPADPTAQARRPEAQQPAGGAAAAPAPAPAAGTAKEDLTYPERLGGGATPRESLKPATSAPRAVEREATPPPPPKPAPAVSEDPPPNEPSGAGFAVQVAAVGERGEADAIVKRLKGKDYPAYVVAPAAGAPRVFRVRIGKYKDRREAERIADRLRREEQFKPWITR
jgi:septal ring-binding cell division protein DamX